LKKTFALDEVILERDTWEMNKVRKQFKIHIKI